MSTRTAERLLGQRLHIGCGANILLESVSATLTVPFTGRKSDRDGKLVGGHVAALVLHGLHDDPGIFECL
jgi:hypothetical protein